MKPRTDYPPERVVVRVAAEGDARDVARVYVDSWNAGFGGLMPHREMTPDLVARWRRDLLSSAPDRWWVADLGGAIVGFVGIGPVRNPPEPTLGELDTIAVAPDHWRRGVGRALMSAALRHLAADDYREAVLWTLSRYERGRRFYEATGWRPDGGARDRGRQIRYRRVLIPPPEDPVLSTLPTK